MLEWNGEIAFAIAFETLKNPDNALGIQAFNYKQQAFNDKQQATEKKER